MDPGTEGEAGGKESIKHPSGQLCGPNMMVKQLPVGQRSAYLERISEQGEVLLFLAYLQLYL